MGAASVASIVLAGGASQRLGRNKAIEEVGGETLIQRVITSLVTFSNQILVVIAQGQAPPPFVSPIPTMVVSDIYPGKGALGGVYTGLRHSGSWQNVVVACDMPFLNPAFLLYMVKASESYDLVIPKIEDKYEPLHAVYTKGCTGPIERLLQQGKMSILELMKIVKARFVTEAERDSLDPEHLSFFNVNTEADLSKARKMAATREGESKDDEGRRGTGQGPQLFQNSRKRA